jgi:ABC-type antimicrobial peptide transport system ATPase subunit
MTKCVVPVNGGYWQAFGWKKQARVVRLRHIGVRHCECLKGKFAHYAVA